MKSSDAALISGLGLLLIGIWGFVANDFSLHTGMTPILSGIIFTLISFRLKHRNKNLIRFCQLFAAILAVLLIVPFKRNAEQMDYAGMLRTFIEIMLCCWAVYIYYKDLKHENTVQ